MSHQMLAKWTHDGRLPGFLPVFICVVYIYSNLNIVYQHFRIIQEGHQAIQNVD